LCNAEKTVSLFELLLLMFLGQNVQCISRDISYKRLHLWQILQKGKRMLPQQHPCLHQVSPLQAIHNWLVNLRQRAQPALIPLQVQPGPHSNLK
jgi:hypothetical protein